MKNCVSVYEKKSVLFHATLHFYNKNHVGFISNHLSFYKNYVSYYELCELFPKC